MFYCIDCKCIFEQPEKVQGDASEYFGQVVREPRYICPECGSEEFVETSEIKQKVQNVLDEYNLSLDTLDEIMG